MYNVKVEQQYNGRYTAHVKSNSGKIYATKTDFKSYSEAVNWGESKIGELKRKW